MCGDGFPKAGHKYFRNFCSGGARYFSWGEQIFWTGGTKNAGSGFYVKG